MDLIFKRITNIRNKIENENFNKINNYLIKNNLKISKDNFNLAIHNLWYIKNDSYCKYVFFIKQYFNKKR